MATKSGGERAPGILNLPIGIKASGERKEFDGLCSVMVWSYPVFVDTGCVGFDHAGTASAGPVCS